MFLGRLRENGKMRRCVLLPASLKSSAGRFFHKLISAQMNGIQIPFHFYALTHAANYSTSSTYVNSFTNIKPQV